MIRRLFLLFALAVLAVSVAAQTQAPAKTAAPSKTPAPAKAPAFKRVLLNPAALVAKAPAEYEVKFTTTKGDFVVKVTREWSPLGADRFYNLVKNGFYDNATLFRVVREPRPFVVQFGISAFPPVSAAWQRAVIKDDPVKASNKRGFITFATGGPNTRTTQVFINLGDNARLDGMGFSPFGEVTQGMEIVDQLYSGYGEDVTDKQGEIASQGNAYLQRRYPKLDRILKATVISPVAAPAGAPLKKATKQ
jgi:peptidyl-prolyl cis-trans isomerase A (cyclophilin A)